MPLFMDVHNLGNGVSMDDVAKAHQADLATQGEYEVSYLRYWVDEHKGQIFCLVEAPDAGAAAEVHRKATAWQPYRPGMTGIRVLLPGSRLELHHQLGRDAAAVFDLDALGFGPLADLGGVQPARRSPPPGPCRPAGSAVGPPRGAHILRKRLAQLLGVFFVQVDLVLGAVQPETDGSLGGAAVKVIDEQGLDLLGHGRLIPLN
jgi:Protein of unknown function (DUF4242)